MTERTERKIKTIETTLANDADVLSVAQVASLNATLAMLRATLSGATPMPSAMDRARMDAAKANAAVVRESEAPVMEAEVVKSEVVTTTAKLTVLPEFVMAGKAIFTVSNPEGKRYTFKVEKPDRYRGEYFASVMTGSDNEASYSYVAMMSEAGNLRTTRGSKMPETDVRFKVLKWALDVVFGRRKAPDGYAIEGSGACWRCGRTLTVPESLHRGYGPECASRVAA